MANKIEYTNINSNKIVASNSRYAESPIIYYGENKYLTFPIYKKQMANISRNDNYTVVTKGQEYRPDLVAMDFYGASIFWHKILETNKIMDIWDFKAGLSIRLPKNVY